jgi:hypothetical protein
MRIERIALLLLVLSGCPGTLDEDEKQRFADYAASHAGSAGSAGGAGMPNGTAGDGAVGDPCGDVPTRIFSATCAGTGCHSAKAPQQELDLESPDVASRVVGVTGKMCLQLLADPQNPEASLLYSKLLPSRPCGVQMPLARPPLSASDIACVRSWIAAQ